MIVIELEWADGLDLLLTILVNTQCYDFLLVLNATILFAMAHIQFYFVIVTVSCKNSFKDKDKPLNQFIMAPYNLL